MGLIRKKGGGKSTSPLPGKKKGLSLRKVDRYLRFVIFLAIIGLVYNFNSHLAERQLRQKTRLQKEVKALKSTYMMKEASLSAASRMIEIRDRVDSLGLRPLESPPYMLVKGNYETEEQKALRLKLLKRQLDEQSPPRQPRKAKPVVVDTPSIADTTIISEAP